MTLMINMITCSTHIINVLSVTNDIGLRVTNRQQYANLIIVDHGIDVVNAIL